MNQARRRTVVNAQAWFNQARRRVGGGGGGGDGGAGPGERRLGCKTGGWVAALLRWGPLVAACLITLLLVADQFPGTVAPFALSTRKANVSGRKHPSSTAKGRPKATVVPWEKWEEAMARGNDANNATARFAGSMVDRHLFGEGAFRGPSPWPSPWSAAVKGGGGGGPEANRIEADREMVARVMIFKLPRSGSTWFTEVLNALPTVFASKEIIQAEFDEASTAHERLRHLKRALLWPTGKLKTGPWGGRFATDYWDPGKWRTYRPKRPAVEVELDRVQAVIEQKPHVTGEVGALDVVGFTVRAVDESAWAPWVLMRYLVPVAGSVQGQAALVLVFPLV
jgi:hypothetical protein